eukprot:GHVS01094002.1.p1 GENE.GHVS01094002.1~~GHVS01094002.1.p1  ORF type:complete len:437 (+),score=46.91 GHVS01094002.1:173-1483(+)
MGKKNSMAAAAGGFLPCRATLGPLALMCLCPPIALFLWWSLTEGEGSLFASSGNCYSFFSAGIPSPWSGPAFLIVAAFCFLAAILTKALPGENVLGPATPTGYRNVYHGNGLLYWIAINCIVVIAICLHPHSLSVVYDYYGNILALLNVFAVALCFCLYIKGNFAPSSQDCGNTGNVIFDFYWGTELHPRVWGFDVKQMTNDRFGMAWWAFACLCFASKQYQLYGYVSDSMLVSVGLQWVYLTKFFVWENGYFYSMDIQHDRGGFYICWGCLVWVPAVYTSSTLWLVRHPITIGPVASIAIVATGLFMIWANYAADRQRQSFRKSGGTKLVWGKAPLTICAEYTDENGVNKRSLLLASGWWGVARHFHYLPEILAALMWSPPVQITYITPYLYTLFLCGLLLDRSYRDDNRCATKYGSYWEQYRSLVPYRLIPHIL